MENLFAHQLAHESQLAWFNQAHNDAVRAHQLAHESQLARFNQAHSDAVRAHQEFTNELNMVHFRNNVAGTKPASEEFMNEYNAINAEIDRVAAEIRAARESMR